jgi:sigma-B regulation protein RsbU (phosphoserine phosphatase)
MTPSTLTTPPAAPASGGSAASAPARIARPIGPRLVDLSGNSRIGLLLDTVRALSRATEPAEVQRVFSERAAELWGPRGYVSVSTRGLRPGEYKITRTILDLGRRDEMTSADPWSRWHAMPVHTGGFIGEIIRSAEPRLLHHLNLRNDPVVGDQLAEYGSMMALPLFDNGQPINWALFFRHEPEGYSETELEEAILRANLVGATVRHTLAAKQLREASARTHAEVVRMAAIQRALLPERVPRIDGLTVAVHYDTFDRVGGDYYDFIPLCCDRWSGHRLSCDEQGWTPDPSGRWGMLIADASGHGPSAAVVMAMLHAILHAYPGEPRGPAEVLQHINRHLCAKRIESSFVTAFFAIYDPKSRSFCYARAGHNPPILKNPGPGGRVRRLDDAGGMPLGIMPDAAFDEATIAIRPGQTIVLYTDGITEAYGDAGEMFGVEGIERALLACTGEPECVVGSITAALRGHEGGIQPHDDQTIVAIKMTAV